MDYQVAVVVREHQTRPTWGSTARRHRCGRQTGLGLQGRFRRGPIRNDCAKGLFGDLRVRLMAKNLRVLVVVEFIPRTNGSPKPIGAGDWGTEGIDKQSSNRRGFSIYQLDESLTVEAAVLTMPREGKLLPRKPQSGPRASRKGFTDSVKAGLRAHAEPRH